MNSPLYINRIAVYPQMGKCDVVFRRGLNVILSDDISAENDKEKIQDTRNSTGKTTFIHLIDYALGKDKFIENLSESNKLLFKEEYVVAEIRIYNEKYTIYRSIINNDIVIIYNNWVTESIINSILGEEPYKVLDLKAYLSFIEDKIYNGKNYFKEKKIISYRSIMNFIIRDQFYGFTKYNSGIKEEHAKVCKDRLEFLFGLATPEKLLIKEKIDEKDKKKKELNNKYKVIKNYFDEVITQTKVQINKNIKTNEIKTVDLSEQLKKYNIRIASMENQKDEKKEIKEKLEIELKEIANDVAVLESRISNYNMSLNENRSELKKLEYIKQSMQIVDSINGITCPIITKSKEVKEQVKCPLIEGDTCDEKNNEIISARKKLIEYEINDLERAIEVLKDQLDKKRINYKCTDDKIKEIRGSIENELNSILEERDLIWSQLKELEYENKRLEERISQYEYLENISENKRQVDKEKKEQEDKLEKLTKDGLDRIVEIYNEVVEYISSNSRDGSINIKSFEPVILFKNGNKDTGAGMKSISIIAFDLTMLTYALEKNSKENYIPYMNILIHDSPKRNDIDLNMYKKVFNYVIRLEKDYPDIEFQYIITTLDISKKVQENKNKYVRLLLDNSGDGGKLFGITVDI